VNDEKEQREGKKRKEVRERESGKSKEKRGIAQILLRR